MKKPALTIDEAEPTKTLRADRPPTNGFVTVVDGHFKSEFDDVQAAEEAGRNQGGLSDASGRNLYDAANRVRTLFDPRTRITSPPLRTWFIWENTKSRPARKLKRNSACGNFPSLLNKSSPRDRKRYPFRLRTGMRDKTAFCKQGSQLRSRREGTFYQIGQSSKRRLATHLRWEALKAARSNSQWSERPMLIILLGLRTSANTWPMWLDGPIRVIHDHLLA